MIYKKQRVAIIGTHDEIGRERAITLELRESHINTLTEIAEQSTHHLAKAYAKGWNSFMKEVNEKEKK